MIVFIILNLDQSYASQIDFKRIPNKVASNTEAGFKQEIEASLSKEFASRSYVLSEAAIFILKIPIIYKYL